VRTTSAKPAKGAEPVRTRLDDLALLVSIAGMLLDWAWRGRRIRRAFRERQRRGEKYWVDVDVDADGA